MKLAMIGFRHSHAMQIHDFALEHPEVTLVASCEEDPQTVAELKSEGKVNVTHTNYQKMLDSVECDAVGVGDTFARRGPLLIEALKRGKQVIADKPICTSLDELAEIAALSKAKKRSVGLLLDLRGTAQGRTARRLVSEGTIGEVHTVTFTGQHPLLFGTRPAWYFVPSQHGGTVNDIGIHGLDAIPWITGRKFAEVTAARGWNARLPQYPDFQDGGQVMMRLDNNGGVLGDLSYLAPDGCGYTAPQYWRFSLHGDGGVIEFTLGKNVIVARSGDKAFSEVPLDPAIPSAALNSFLRETKGDTKDLPLTTAEVLESSRVALMAQRAADEKLFQLAI